MKCAYCKENAKVKCGQCGKPICRKHNKDGACAETVPESKPRQLRHGTLVYDKPIMVKRHRHYRD